MTVSPLRKSVIYKDHTITIRQSDNQYVFSIMPTVEIQLSGVAPTLEIAFERARDMIDKLSKDHE